jgi:RNA polymerase sigma-70 factor (ECF subfamily)
LLPDAVAGRLRGCAELGSLLQSVFEASAAERAAYGISDEDLLRAILRPFMASDAAGASEEGDARDQGDPGHARDFSDELAPVRGLHAADVALAVACAAGQRAALAELDRRFTPEIASALRRVDPSPGFVDEALQAVRERLLLRSDRGEPRIASYSGAGSLGGWLRAVAVRVALNLRRGGLPQVSLDEKLADGLSLDAPGPEQLLMKRQYREAFQEAFRAALDKLSNREVNVLRLHYVGGISLGRLGETYGVHRATIARWLASSKERLLWGTQRELQARLRVSADEFQQIMDIVRSQLVLTLTRALGGTQPPP